MYFFVEQKFRYAKKAQKGVKQTLFYWGVLLLALAILLSCTLIRKNKGLPSRIENSHRVLSASQIECDFTQGKRRQECTFGDKENGQKKVLLIGDSHSFNLRYGLDLFGRSEGVGFYSIAFAGCPPITGVKLHNQGKLRPDKSCLDFSEKLNDILFSEQYLSLIHI